MPGQVGNVLLRKPRINPRIRALLIAAVVVTTSFVLIYFATAPKLQIAFEREDEKGTIFFLVKNEGYFPIHSATINCLADIGNVIPTSPTITGISAGAGGELFCPRRQFTDDMRHGTIKVTYLWFFGFFYFVGHESFAVERLAPGKYALIPR